MEEAAGLFIASFAAATLLPLPSEAALFAYLKAFPEQTVLAVAVATVGNTAGGMTSYLIGRLFPQKKMNHKYIPTVKKLSRSWRPAAWRATSWSRLWPEEDGAGLAQVTPRRPAAWRPPPRATSRPGRRN